jgi:hypothetical protein
MGNSLDSSCIAPPFGRMLSVSLVIMGTIVVIVLFFTLLLFEVPVLLTPVFNPVACNSAVDDVEQISIISVLSSVAFLRWSETACRVPVRTLLVVRLVTLCFIIMVMCRVNHGCYVQHRLEVLHVCINFFDVLWQVGCATSSITTVCYIQHP